MYDVIYIINVRFKIVDSPHSTLCWYSSFPLFHYKNISLVHRFSVSISNDDVPVSFLYFDLYMVVYFSLPFHTVVCMSARQPSRHTVPATYKF